MAPALSDELRGFTPSKTLPEVASRVVARQQGPVTVTVTVTAIPVQGGNDPTTLSGGAIAGIVIGSIAGLILLWWIFRSCTNLGAPLQEQTAWYDDVEATRRPSHSGHHHHHRHHSSDHRRSHSRRGSVEVRGVTAMPAVVVREGSGADRSPRRPSGTYVVQEGRGRSKGRYYASG